MPVVNEEMTTGISSSIYLFCKSDMFVHTKGLADVVCGMIQMSRSMVCHLY